MPERPHYTITTGYSSSVICEKYGVLFTFLCHVKNFTTNEKYSSDIKIIATTQSV